MKVTNLSISVKVGNCREPSRWADWVPSRTDASYWGYANEPIKNWIFPTTPAAESVHRNKQKKLQMYGRETPERELERLQNYWREETQGERRWTTLHKCVPMCKRWLPCKIINKIRVILYRPVPVLTWMLQRKHTSSFIFFWTKIHSQLKKIMSIESKNTT